MIAAILSVIATIAITALIAILILRVSSRCAQAIGKPADQSGDYLARCGDCREASVLNPPVHIPGDTLLSAPNVLRVNAVEEQTAERNAVARILLDIQREHSVTLLDIAEKIDVSLGTISNAANKKTDLCRTYLKRLGLAFGGHYLDPFHALYGVRASPIVGDPEADALPSTTAAIHKLALARSPNSKGGERITHCELLGMEQEIDAAIRALSSLKLKCNLVRSVA